MQKFCLVKSHIFNEKNSKNVCKVFLFGNRKFLIPFWSMFNLLLKLKFCFFKGIFDLCFNTKQIMDQKEHGILVLIQPLQTIFLFLGLKKDE